MNRGLFGEVLKYGKGINRNFLFIFLPFFNFESTILSLSQRLILQDWTKRASRFIKK